MENIQTDVRVKRFKGRYFLLQIDVKHETCEKLHCILMLDCKGIGFG